MESDLTSSASAKLIVAEHALSVAVSAFSDFDNSATAWRKILNAESECREALSVLAAGHPAPMVERGSSCFFGQTV